VTVDLTEIALDTGAAVLYKWGAAPSCLVRAGIAEKIGTAGQPPGIHGADLRETRERLSLRRGEMLIILSDGVDGEEIRRRAVAAASAPAGEAAARLLDTGAAGGLDDATVAVVRLRPGC
jgi:serine phosphatase RsbU (regulator of sigma subunit)